MIPAPASQKVLVCGLWSRPGLSPICAIGTYDNASDVYQLAPVDGKVSLCHVADNQREKEISIHVDDVADHISHGDTVGPCPA